MDFSKILMGHSRTTLQEAMNDLKKLDIDEKDFSFCSFVADRCGGFVQRKNELDWFEDLWYAIPDKYLYETYKNMLRETRWFDQSWLFHPTLVGRVMSLNRHDTVDNLDLKNLLAADGYLTVYCGYAKKTLHNDFWWTLSEEVAKWRGNTKAMFERKDEFCVVKGKVKPESIITYITSWGKEEIFVLNKNVVKRVKQGVFPYKQNVIK